MADFDLVIRGGTVVDGTRFPAFTADVGIRDGRIASIGRLSGASARRVLDADGLVVAPGFVDLHTHYDAQIQWDPWCTISGWHGVTSVALGNCGFGFAPVHPEQRERAMLTMSRLEAIPLASMREGMLWDWETFPQFLDTLARIPKGVNCLSYAPLAPLLTYVMGLENAKQRPATPAEMERMLRLLGESLDAGALGWSVQRTGTGSIQCDHDGTPMVTDTMSEEDLLAFASALAGRGEGFIQLTNATGDLPKDLDLCERVAAASGKPVLFNVVLAVTELPWVHKMFVDWLAACQAKGLRMFGQANSIRAPFRLTLADWNLFDSSPAWRRALTGTHAEKKQKLADPELRAAMAAEADAGLLQTILLGGPPAGFVFEGAKNAPELDRFLGLTVGEIAKETGVHPVEAMLQLALASDLEAGFLTKSATSDNPEFVGELLALAVRDPRRLRRRRPHEVPDRRLLHHRHAHVARARREAALPRRRRTTSSRTCRRAPRASRTAARCSRAGRRTWSCTTSRASGACPSGGTPRSPTTSRPASGAASSAPRATTTRS